MSVLCIPISAFFILFYVGSVENITQEVAGENVTYDSQNNTFGMFLPAFSHLAVEITVFTLVETLKDFQSTIVATNRTEITENNDSIC
jgi:hypothetical protein